MNLSTSPADCGGTLQTPQALLLLILPPGLRAGLTPDMPSARTVIVKDIDEAQALLRDLAAAQAEAPEPGELELTPSIAMRALKDFRADVGVQLPPFAVHSEADSLAGKSQALTGREVDVLRLIAKGYKAPEAAGLLGLSRHTVTGYVREIYRKLGISSRAEAAMEAARRGLVR